MVWWFSCLKLLAEVALMAYAARAVLGWLAGSGAPSNVMYRVFCTVTQPVERLVSRCSGGRVTARSLPWWGAGLALMLWLGSAGLKVAWCVEAGKVVCS